MRLFPQELLIMKLRGTLPDDLRLDEFRRLSKDECIAELRDYSGKDFGDDADAWSNWFRSEQARWDREANDNGASPDGGQSSHESSRDAETLSYLLKHHAR